MLFPPKCFLTVLLKYITITKVSYNKRITSTVLASLSLYAAKHVTRFGGLPHTSTFMTLKDHNLVFVKAKNLKPLPSIAYVNFCTVKIVKK